MPTLARRRGFTLLEVMVAVAILSVALTSIFSAEAGAIRMAARSRHLTTASLLARCKMGEIEENVARLGLPAVGEQETDGCCEDGEVEGFECDWKIERIVLPEAAPTGADAQGGAAGSGGSGGAIGGLLNNSAGGGASAGAMGAAGAGGMDAIMAGAMGGGESMIAQATMSFIYPVLKPTLEEQIRRATVTVRWHEGQSAQSFDVTQYLVAEPRLP